MRIFLWSGDSGRLVVSWELSSRQGQSQSHSILELLIVGFIILSYIYLSLL